MSADIVTSRRRGAHRLVIVAVYILVAGVSATLPASPTSAKSPTSAEWSPLPSDRRSLALAAADEFLDRYLMPSGRVSRLDQGGDTVSEGQAYGMLLAVALGDEPRFRRVWDWTDDHLQRSDGLFAWHWVNGGIADYYPATDADLLIAAALALASRRFGDADLRAQAQRVSDGVLAYETVSLGDARVLVAGTWARRWRMVNASYLVTPAMSSLYERLPEYDWGRVAWTSRLLLADMMDESPHLPPDWAVVDAGGVNPQAVPSPDGASPRYSYDASRVIVQTAVDCRAAGQRLSASTWPFLRAQIDAGTLTMSYTLAGEPIGLDRHPLAFVAAAAAAAAAGDRSRADALLVVAAARDDAAPTYFGAAWVALGRLWLDTDLIGGCRPGAPARA